MAEDHSLSDKVAAQVSPAGLAGDYLRSFAQALGQIDGFDGFSDALKQVIAEDSYLDGSAELSDSIRAAVEVPDFEALDATETIVSVAGAEGNTGYLKYRSRRDGEPFGSEDLHLMGAIAGFIAVLGTQAKRFRKGQESAKVFQYLINQLPLGVVCFNRDGELLIRNKAANRLLGEDGSSLLGSSLKDESLLKNGQIRMHMEVGDRFIFTEGRCLQVDEDLGMTAFVLHDMSGQRDKLHLQLERAAYRAESKGLALTLALFEDRSEAGRIYRALRESKDVIKLSAGNVQSLDAYTCACIFPEKSLRTVRYLFRNTLPKPFFEGSVTAALISKGQYISEDSPAKYLLEKAGSELTVLSQALRPGMLVMDPYEAVLQSLEVMASDVSAFESVVDLDAASQAIASGRYDGIFVDVDSFACEEIESLQSVADAAGAGFRIYYVSHMQPSMVYTKYRLGVEATVFQKPFDAVKVHETLALQFNFA